LRLCLVRAPDDGEMIAAPAANSFVVIAGLNGLGAQRNPPVVEATAAVAAPSSPTLVRQTMVVSMPECT
jgi:hypothetical protein